MILMRTVFIALLAFTVPPQETAQRSIGAVILAQGTDKLPGGVEHLPSPQGQPAAPSMSAPPVMSPPPPMPDEQSAPDAVAPDTLDAAPPWPEEEPKAPAKSGSKKKKKAAPAAKSERSYKSISPGPAAPGTSGDDKIPGGVERSPDVP